MIKTSCDEKLGCLELTNEIFPAFDDIKITISEKMNYVNVKKFERIHFGDNVKG